MKRAVSQISLTERTLYYIVLLALPLFFISDAINKFLDYFLQTSGNSVSIYIRALFEVFCLSYIAININNFKKNTIYLLLLFFITVITSNALYFKHQEIKSIFYITENFVRLNKFFFEIFIIMTIYKIKEYPQHFLKILYILELIFTINALLAILGLIFNIDICSTYLDSPWRFGYNGLIKSQNESSLFYIIALSYFYYKNYFVQSDIKFYLIVIASLIVGTKALYLFVFLLLIFHLVCHYNKRTVLILISAITIVIAVALLLLRDFLTTQIQTLAIFEQLYHEHGFLYAVSSGRSKGIFDVLVPTLQNWTLLNYAFGGFNLQANTTETDLIDIFLFFGAGGAVLYIYLYIKTVLNLNYLNIFNIFWSITYFCIASIAGHFLSGATNALYLCLFVLYIQYHQNNPANETNAS